MLMLRYVSYLGLFCLAKAKTVSVHVAATSEFPLQIDKDSADLIYYI